MSSAPAQASQPQAPSQASSESSSNVNSGGVEAAKEIAELKRNLSQVQSQYQQAESQSRETAETLSKIRQVFTPEDTAPVDKENQFLDYYLQQSLEAEKNGTPIPLTTNLAVKLVETRKQLEEVQAKLDQALKRVETIADPTVAADNAAYTAIDNMLESTLASIYGENEFTPQKFQAVAGEIVAEVKRLQESEPAVWDKIRRSRQYQEQMVRYFVEKSVPQRARQIMRAEQVRNTPMGRNDLLQALREANEIQDSKTRSRIKDKIRQEFLSETMAEPRRRGVNQAYR